MVSRFEFQKTQTSNGEWFRGLSFKKLKPRMVNYEYGLKNNSENYI